MASAGPTLSAPTHPEVSLAPARLDTPETLTLIATVRLNMSQTSLEPMLQTTRTTLVTPCFFYNRPQVDDVTFRLLVAKVCLNLCPLIEFFLLDGGTLS